MATANILWRVATFHLVVVVSGFFAALYHSRPHEDYHYANRQTFVDLQLATFEERKLSSDTLYETKQLSRKEIQKRLQGLNPVARDPDAVGGDGPRSHRRSLLSSRKRNPKRRPKRQGRKKKGDETPDEEKEVGFHRYR
jgi:hypothetical protein